MRFRTNKQIMKKILFFILNITFLSVINCFCQEFNNQLSNKEPVQSDSKLDQSGSPSGTSVIYILRPTKYLGTWRLDVNCDGQFIGTTKGNNFVYTNLHAGKHKIETIGENTEELDIILDSGKVYYIEQVPRMGVWSPRSSLFILNAKEGQEKLSNCQLSANNVKSSVQLDSLKTNLSNPENQIYRPSPAQEKNSTPEVNQSNQNKPLSERVRTYYMLTVSDMQGVHATGFNVTLYSYANKIRSGWIFPFTITISEMSINQSYFQQFNFQSAKLNYYTFGFNALKKLNDYFWFNLGLDVPIGSEILTDFSGNVTNNFIIGIAPKQGIYFIPKSLFGIIFSIGVFEEILSSEVYKNDIGLKAEIGLKF